MTRFKISFEGNDYPAVEYFDEEVGYDVTISVEDLQDRLMDGGEEPKNLEAEHIDNEVYFYVPTSVIVKSEEEIEAYVSDKLY